MLAVRHSAYLNLDPDEVVAMTGRPVAVVDCFGILNDDQISRYFELGCEVRGWPGACETVKDKVNSKRRSQRREAREKRAMVCWL